MWNIKRISGRFIIPCVVGARCLGKTRTKILGKTSVEILVYKNENLHTL